MAKRVTRRTQGRARTAAERKRRTLLVYALLSLITVLLITLVLTLPSGRGDEHHAVSDEAVADETVSDDAESVPERPSADGTLPEEAAGDLREPPGDVPEAPDTGADVGPDVGEDGPRVAAIPRPHAGRLYFVIDDAGYNLHQLEPFLSFPGALTIAVLPQLPYSESAAVASIAAGKEVILHQPMEALNGNDPGPGAIYLGDDSERIRAVLDRNLETVPGAVGMNNHMGSRVTSDRATMEKVLLDAARRNLYFLDSRTAVGTVVAETARSLGLSILERNVFLDNDPDRDSIEIAIREGLEIASQRGHAVMIGHVMVSELAEALHDLYPEMLEQGYELLPLSHLLTNGRDDALLGHAHPRD